ELLLVDDETRRLLREPGSDVPLRAALLAGRPPGSQSFDVTLVALARSRRITAESAISRATDPAAVRALLAQSPPEAPGAPSDDAAEEDAVEDDARAD
ncbi:MAG TPA: hypothetical protein VMT47_09365, partial [Polyangia bacterium]|nr:hypothetical protein [Polyangia bacterium]